MPRRRCEFSELYGGAPYCEKLDIQLPNNGGERPIPYRPANCPMSEVTDNSCFMLPQNEIRKLLVQFQSEEFTE